MTGQRNACTIGLPPGPGPISCDGLGLRHFGAELAMSRARDLACTIRKVAMEVCSQSIYKLRKGAQVCAGLRHEAALEFLGVGNSLDESRRACDRISPRLLLHSPERTANPRCNVYCRDLIVPWLQVTKEPLSSAQTPGYKCAGGKGHNT